MTQTDFVFDRQESARRKERGMTVAADHASTLLDKAREIATEIARNKGEVTTDDVSMELGRRGWPDCLGPARCETRRLDLPRLHQRLLGNFGRNFARSPGSLPACRRRSVSLHPLLER